MEKKREKGGPKHRWSCQLLKIYQAYSDPLAGPADHQSLNIYCYIFVGGPLYIYIYAITYIGTAIYIICSHPIWIIKRRFIKSPTLSSSYHFLVLTLRFKKSVELADMRFSTCFAYLYLVKSP